ncbi:MAG TPA: hypothetical protein VF587_16195 [Solirubrobacteraceae bacterium]|jgi:hypothetical protein
MAGKISVIGDVPVEATLPVGRRGARVLVAAAGEDVRDAARLAPAAVLLVVDGTQEDVDRVLRETLWPRQRVRAVPYDEVERAVREIVEG